MTTAVDPVAWRAEAERLAPVLSRIRLPANGKGGAASDPWGDWRANLDKVHASSRTIKALWPGGKEAVEKLQGELKGSLEKLETRERLINERADRWLIRYRAQRERLASIQVGYSRRGYVSLEAHSPSGRPVETAKEFASTYLMFLYLLLSPSHETRKLSISAPRQSASATPNCSR